MSRRASVFARNNPGKRRVRFPDEVIFEHEVKEQDGHAVINMLRRASIDIDINRINSAGKNLKGLKKESCRKKVSILPLKKVSIFANFVNRKSQLFVTFLIEEISFVKNLQSFLKEKCF